MANYKIGTISKLLGIPNVTLRYYESYGILSPTKDNSSGYRSYSPWDLNTLLRCRQYRSYGFTLNDVKDMLYEDDVQAIYNRFTARESELIDTIRHYEEVLEVLSRRRKRLSQISSGIGKFRLENSPELLMMHYRYCYELFLTDDVTSVAQKWLQAEPTAAQSFQILQYPLDESTECEEGDEGYNDDEEYCESLWGFTMTLDEARSMGLKLEHPVEHLPSRKCIHTILKAGPQGTLIPSLKQQVLQPLTEQGYRFEGDVLGRVIVYAQEDGQLVRYYDVWVPLAY